MINEQRGYILDVMRSTCRGHRCKERTLQVLTICDDEEAKKGGGSKASVEEEELHLSMAEVSLNSVVRFTSILTMNVRREIRRLR